MELRIQVIVKDTALGKISKTVDDITISRDIEKLNGKIAFRILKEYYPEIPYVGKDKFGWSATVSDKISANHHRYRRYYLREVKVINGAG